jgi:tripartite-type tricarboxylate transporter receptor subunit TctC
MAGILATVALALPDIGNGADAFAGKQIRIVIPADSAGAYALYGQLAVSHLERFIPGNPSVVISYMPGAAGLRAMNYLYEVAPRDGTVIAVLNQDFASKQALRVDGVRYDASRFNYVGRATTNVPVHMVWHSAGANTINDIKVREIVTGAVGAGGQADLPRAQNALIGTKWKVIGGYRGGNEARIAMERGETQAAIAPAILFNTSLKGWRERDMVRVVVQYADFRHPTFPDVPALTELADTAEARGVFRLLVSLATLGRAFAAPPDVPSGTMAILRQAFHAMVNDLVFKADAERRGADLQPMAAEELAAYVRGIVATPRDIVRKTNEVLAAR